MKEALARRLLDLLPPVGAALVSGVVVGDVARLLQEVLEDSLEVFPDGRMLIWSIARHDGYDIPAYPMAGCGDVKEFLSDEGARNVPHWYELRLGMPRDVYDSIWEYELVMVRNARYYRRVWTVPASVMQRGTETTGPLLDLQRAWLEFALGCTTDVEDPRLFKR